MSRGAKATVISNRFIDEIMPAANGSYVKVYIYLLRLISDSSEISLQLLADRLDETEKDIRRALKYWEEAGVLSVKYNTLNQITDIIILNPETGVEREKPADIIKLYTGATPVNSTQEDLLSDFPAPAPAGRMVSVESVPENHKVPSESAPVEQRPVYSPSQVKQLLENEEVGTFVKSLDQKLHRPITPADLQLVIFFCDCLRFDINLINYLYDYCISRNKTSSNSYIEKVALNWASEGIRSVEQAQERNVVRNEHNRAVMRAFGLNREPVPAELAFIGTWFNDYGFSAELVEEACNRTMLAISKPDFKYANRILESWNAKGVHSLSDLSSVDAERKTERVKTVTSQPVSRPVQTNNAFTRFPQRNYSKEELSGLEEFLLKKQQG